MESHERVLEAAENIVKGVDDVRDRSVIEDAHPEDLAQALRHLPVPNLVGIFRLLRPEQAASLLSELDDATLIQLVQGLEDVEVADSLNRMPAEEAAPSGGAASRPCSSASISPSWSNSRSCPSSPSSSS